MHCNIFGIIFGVLVDAKLATEHIVNDNLQIAIFRRLSFKTHLHVSWIFRI